jgi:ABC-type transport system involved in multi-copper enzyme maturation permease subunit
METSLDLERIKERKALRGYANLFRKENQAWWGTRRWWINALLWSGMLGGLVLVMLYILPPLAAATGDPNVAEAGGQAAFGLLMARQVFFELGTLAVSIGVIVLFQDMIVNERQSGLTEWLLAKPIARRSYVLSKLSASLLVVLIILITLPALFTYLLLSLGAGSFFPPGAFLGGLGVMVVNSVFYLTLTLMLGTFFTSRPPLLGIALGAVLGGNLLASFIKPLLYVTPWMLPKVASLVAGGQPVSDGMLWPPLITSVVWSVLFILIALMKFKRTEF